MKCTAITDLAISILILRVVRCTMMDSLDTEWYKNMGIKSTHSMYLFVRIKLSASLQAVCVLESIMFVGQIVCLSAPKAPYALHVCAMTNSDRKCGRILITLAVVPH